MLKCEPEEMCLLGKCIRQHFKICLFHCAADFVYLCSDLIFQYNVFGLCWHLESCGWMAVNSQYFDVKILTGMGNLGISFSIVLCTSFNLSFNLTVLQLPPYKPEISLLPAVLFFYSSYSRRIL